MEAVRSVRFARLGLSESESIGVVIASYENAGIFAGFFMRKAIQKRRRNE